jgi:hypothetical protein
MGQNAKQDVDLVRQGRRGIGEEGDLMIDAGLVWDAKTALQRAHAFEEFNPFWLEEPLSPDDYEGYRKLSEGTSIRIAVGEEESNRLSFLELMDKGQIDVVQVDLTRCGGFTEAMKIASLAQDRGLAVANHGFTTYINVNAALHFLNSIPNSLIVEFVVDRRNNIAQPDHSPETLSSGWLPEHTRFARLGDRFERRSYCQVASSLAATTDCLQDAPRSSRRASTRNITLGRNHLISTSRGRFMLNLIADFGDQCAGCPAWAARSLPWHCDCFLNKYEIRSFYQLPEVLA